MKLCKECGREVEYVPIYKDGLLVDSDGGIDFDDGFLCDLCLAPHENIGTEWEKQ